MVADGGGDVGLEREQLLEEDGNEVVEGGHGEPPVRGPASLACRPVRRSNGPRRARACAYDRASMATELTIINGRVLGADGADAVRVRDGLIVAVGRASDIGRAGEVVDARGRPGAPGLRRRPHPRPERCAVDDPGPALPAADGRGDPGRRPRARGGKPGRALGPGPRLAVCPVPGRPAARRPCSTGSFPTGRRGWTATTATPAGRTPPPCVRPASTARRPTLPTA